MADYSSANCGFAKVAECSLCPPKWTLTLFKLLAVYISSFSLPQNNRDFKDLSSLHFTYVFVGVGGYRLRLRRLEALDPSGAGVARGCESPSVGAGNQSD